MICIKEPSREQALSMDIPNIDQVIPIPALGACPSRPGSIEKTTDTVPGGSSARVWESGVTGVSVALRRPRRNGA
jgi:hypothetical protein